MNAIELKNVNFSYDGKTQILGNVNLTLSYGEVNLIAGHSGEGKSTLLYIISGIIPNITDGKLAGEVLINGENIQGKRLGEICRKVGVVLQNADEQIIQKTVEDEIAFGCENLAFSPEKISKQIDTVCRLMKLDKSWQSRKLSGGQKQRVAIAGAIAIEPEILIMDESTSMLDPKGRREVMEVARTLNKEKGMTVIDITHYMDEAAEADCVYVLDNGRIRLKGTPKEVFEKKEVLRACGLELPRAALIAEKLRRAGVPLSPDILDAEKLAEELCESLRKN